MCDTPIPRITMCVLTKDIDRQLRLELVCTRVSRMMLINLCTAAIKRMFDREQNLTAVERISLLCKSCSRVTGEGRVGFKGRGGGAGG